MRRGELAPLGELLNEEIFWREATDRSYCPAGSFIRYIIDRWGIAKFRTLYSTKEWSNPASDFKRLFKTAVGSASSMARHAQRLGQQWLHGSRRVAEVLPGTTAS